MLLPSAEPEPLWYERPGNMKIALQPGEAKISPMGHDTVIIKKIGGETFRALVPTHTLDENLSSVPVAYAGHDGDRVILYLPISNEGRPTWTFPEKYLADILTDRGNTGIKPVPEPEPWYRRPGHLRIALEPGEAELSFFDHDTIITKVIGRTTFEAMVPTHTMGENLSSVPVAYAGAIDGDVILYLPVSNNGRATWKFPEQYLKPLLVR